MNIEQKQRIAAMARVLIESLEDCDNSEFVDFIIECVTFGDSSSLDVGRWWENND